ncbi:membrane protein [Latilactobacillus graminis DSM 20719]|uniref:Membrane protein n=1 Tax=Latilactobacillus graminis DSM 20719 TaxID=1423752 RepID=A0AA89HZN9_9LACO|nr:membrane protein [Latilactobacillus graminis DSM 20719]
MAATAYDSLVIHSATWDRTLFSALICSTLMLFIKVPLERPLTIMAHLTPHRALKALTNFFLVERSLGIKIANFIFDGILFCLATYLLRRSLPLNMIAGRLLGWCVLALLLSISIGASVGFKVLTIQQDTSVEND